MELNWIMGSSGHYQGQQANRIARSGRVMGEKHPCGSGLQLTFFFCCGRLAKPHPVTHAMDSTAAWRPLLGALAVLVASD